MADDDEVDVLGDFSLPLEGSSNFLDNTHLVSQNSDLLNCEYTIHPQWLLDKPSGNPDNWYEDNSPATTPDVSDTDTMGHISTENCITDESGWTEKEKNLLQRGLEIFGKSSGRLSQFIGSKTSSEVKYYLKNFFTESLSHYQQAAVDTALEHIPGLVRPDVVDSDQIPASMEEVIAVVSTGFPTIATLSDNTKSDQRQSPPQRQLASIPRKPLQKPQIFKKHYKLKLKSEQINKHKLVKLKTKRKIRHGSLQQTDFMPTDEYLQQNHSSTREIITGKGLSVPISEGEEIVTIKNAEGDSSDVSIDVEDVNDSDGISKVKTPVEEINGEKKPSLEMITDSTRKVGEGNFVIDDHMDEDIAKQLNCLDVPLSEVILDKHEVTKLEKFIHRDFFEDRPSKTPERYLKIRNHIIDSWDSSKPIYIYKTAMRPGLKNCGDVKCISKIHYFLEQIGAINFGCEQTKYERPLGKAFQFWETLKTKSVKQPKALISREPTKLGPRQRFKKKFTNDGEGGCTMVHGEKGEIIDTTIVNEEPVKPRPYIKKPTIRLIYCRPFTVEKPEYSVKISLSTIILMDFHSHLYLTEVMGLVGGSWNYIDGTLRICCYEPCRNIASSTTHCDMCPISQARAADNIHDKNLEILGWFHSHPTFAPEPSQQDLDTQQAVQQWIGHGKPCIGIIMSPFSVNAALISSPFRCWMVDKKPNFEDQLVPYRFKVDVTTDDFDLSSLLDSMGTILFAHDETILDKRIPFHKAYFQDFSISHLDKFLSSVNMHLAKTGTLARSRCDEITQGIRDLIKKNL